MNKILLSLAVACLSPLAALAEIVTLVSHGIPMSEPLVLKEGESAKLLHLLSSSSQSNYLEIQFVADGPWVSFSPVTFNLDNMAIAGPASIRVVKAQFATTAMASFEVDRAKEPEILQPTAAAVIPEDENGQFQVLLESSTDTLNWSPAQTGTYGGGTTKRFFRTRIVKVN